MDNQSHLCNGSISALRVLAAIFTLIAAFGCARASKEKELGTNDASSEWIQLILDHEAPYGKCRIKVPRRFMKGIDVGNSPSPTTANEILESDLGEELMIVYTPVMPERFKDEWPDIHRRTTEAQGAVKVEAGKFVGAVHLQRVDTGRAINLPFLLGSASLRDRDRWITINYRGPIVNSEAAKKFPKASDPETLTMLKAIAESVRPIE